MAAPPVSLVDCSPGHPHPPKHHHHLHHHHHHHHQGKAIISQLGSVARVSVPMFVYFLLMFGVSLVVAWYAKMPYAYAATQAFTASSNKCVEGWF